MLVIDASATIVSADTGFAELIGLSTIDDALGKPLTTYLHAQHETRCIVHFLFERQQWQGPLTAQRRSGEPTQVMGSAIHVPSKDPDATHIVLSLTAPASADGKGPVHSELYKDMFHTLFEHYPDPIYVLDTEGRIRDLNQAGTGIHETTKEQMVGRLIADMSDPVSAQKAIGRIKRAAAGETLSFESGQMLPGNVFMPLKVVLAPFEFNGETRLLGICRDLRSTLAAEHIIRKSEERPRLALQSARQGLYDLNVQTGECVVNDEYATMLGYDPKTFVETNAAWIERLHPDDHEPVAQNYLDYVAGKIEDYRVEFRQRMADGRWKWILSIGKIIEHDEQGRPLRFVGTHTDIDDIKAAREILRSTAERAQVVLSGTKQGFYDCNLQTGKVFVSMEYAQMLGYEAAEMNDINSAWIDHLHPDDVEAAQRRYRNFVDGEIQTYQTEFRMKARDGRWVWILSIANILAREEDGKALRIIGTHTDITEQKDAEEGLQRQRHTLMQAERISLANGLSSVVAHELNQPLCAIANHVATILHTTQGQAPDIQGIRQDAEHASIAVHRAANIIRRFRQLFARQRAATQLCLMPDLIEQCLLMIRAEIRDHHIRVCRAFAEQLPPIAVDPTLLQQVVLNLVQNAIDAMSTQPDDKRELTIGLEIEQATSRLRLSVCDTGPGFPAHARDNLFEAKNSDKTTGLGVGLCICRLIARAHGGEIKLEASSKQGSTVAVYLPLYSEPSNQNMNTLQDLRMPQPQAT